MRHSSKACATIATQPGKQPKNSSWHEQIWAPLPPSSSQQQPRLPANLELLADIARPVPGKWTWRYRHGNGTFNATRSNHTERAMRAATWRWCKPELYGLAGGRAPIPLCRCRDHHRLLAQRDRAAG